MTDDAVELSQAKPNEPAVELSEANSVTEINNLANRLGENALSEAQRDKLAKAGGKISRDGEKPYVEWKDLEGVKEEDIINYMMNEWFIKAMNKGFSGACYGVEWLYKQGEFYYDQYAADKAVENAKTEKEQKEIKAFKEKAKNLWAVGAECLSENIENIDKRTNICGMESQLKDALNAYITTKDKTLLNALNLGPVKDVLVHLDDNRLSAIAALGAQDLQTEINSIRTANGLHEEPTDIYGSGNRLKDDLQAYLTPPPNQGPWPSYLNDKKNTLLQNLTPADLQAYVNHIDPKKMQENENNFSKITSKMATQLAMAQIAREEANDKTFENLKEEMKRRVQENDRKLTKLLEKASTEKQAQMLMELLQAKASEAAKNASNPPAKKENKALDNVERMININFEERRTQYQQQNLPQFTQEGNIFIDNRNGLIQGIERLERANQGRQKTHEEREEFFNAWIENHPDKGAFRLDKTNPNSDFMYELEVQKDNNNNTIYEKEDGAHGNPLYEYKPLVVDGKIVYQKDPATGKTIYRKDADGNDIKHMPLPEPLRDAAGNSILETENGQPIPFKKLDRVGQPIPALEYEADGTTPKRKKDSTGQDIIVGRKRVSGRREMLKEYYNKPDGGR